MKSFLNVAAICLMSFALLLISACTASEAPIPADKLAMVDDLELKSQANEVQLSIIGNLRNGCEKIDEKRVSTSRDTTTISLSIREEGEVCIQALMPYIENVTIPRSELGDGKHRFIVNGYEESFTLP